MHAVIIIDEAHVSKGRFVLTREHEAFANDVVDHFGDILIRTGESEIVNLAKEENFDTAERSGVYCTIMCGTSEIEFRGKQNGIDMAFP